MDIPLATWPGIVNNKLLGYFPSFYGFWLDNTRWVVSVLQDVPDAYEKGLARIVMIDTSTGKNTVLVEQGYMSGETKGCWSKQYPVIVYLPFGVGVGHYEKVIPDTYRYVNLDVSGNVSELTGPPPFDYLCVPPEKKVESSRGTPPLPLRGGDGYIDVSDKYKTRLELGTAKLVRPRLPPHRLGDTCRRSVWSCVFVVLRQIPDDFI